ncbi:target of Myb1 membrane trafficking protein-like isoform X3 [Anguilla rostrata]|uniref:target of Myb1 membrane trafficking protein-like isoform X3 n=1 Tax=Anguilla rostrata TaxID=7938 RepID=UPI0030D2AE44
MDFLIGSPFATPVGQRIERATSSSLQSEDWGLNMEICDIINETEEGPKDAARAIKKRIAGNKNFREVMLALTVLETCVKNCGHRFHVLVSTRGFVEGVLVRAIMPKNNPPMVLQDRVLSLIQAWADAFRSSPSLTGVVSVYENLRKRGLVFPTATDTVSPIHTPHKVEDVRSAAAVSALPQHPAAAPNHGGVLTTSPDRVGKLRSDLEVVRGNMTVMSEMMNELEPGQAQQSDIELLQQLYTVCKCMQDRVVELIPRLSEEGLIEELLVINDEFNTIFTRYHSFEEHCGGQDPPEQSQAAAPTCVNLIDLSPDTPTVSQPVLPAEPAQQPLSQSPVNTLSNQMADLSTGEDDEFDMFALSRSRVMAQQGNGVPCVEQSSEPDQSVAVDDKQNSAEIPVSQANVMDDIEKWLSIDVEDDPNDGVTSEEFDKFLELRAQAAERLPSISAASPSTASPQAQSARQQSQSPDQMSAF